MPFDQQTGGTDLQAIMTILTEQAKRMDRIETRLDRIIDAQHSTRSEQATSIPVPQFTILTIMAAVAIVAILVAIYYGGNAG